MFGFASISEAPISAQPNLEENTLNLPYFENSNTLYAMTAVQEQFATLPLLTNTSTFYGFSLGLEGELPSLVNVNTLYPPSVQFVVGLPLLTNTNTLYAPTISSFDVTKQSQTFKLSFARYTSLYMVVSFRESCHHPLTVMGFRYLPQ